MGDLNRGSHAGWPVGDVTCALTEQLGTAGIPPGRPFAGCGIVFMGSVDECRSVNLAGTGIRRVTRLGGENNLGKMLFSGLF
jgi:hypothetical protein